jgi:hypothetical protein
MLSPEYLLRVSEGGEKIAESLHNDIISKIVDRIAVRLDRGDDYILTAQDKWQIEVLQESGMLLEDIQKILAQSTGLMQKEIAEAMEDAGVNALEYDDNIYRAAGLSPKALEQSPYLVRLMQRNYEATLGEWDNFTRTMATATQQSFIKACNNAYMQVASGAFSYSEAFVDAIKGIVEDGVYVEYPSGHRDTIETATLRCIRTGVSQATAQITDARMDEMDWDIILVSSHLGARVTGGKDLTDHAWWQGKFYSKSGKDERFPPFSVCGQGHVQGIHGANCRHSHGPGDGEFNPYEQYDSEENRKAYETQQRQRTLERRIRDSKRKCMGLKEAAEKAGTPEGKAKAEAEYKKQAALLQKRNAAYNKFCEDNGLKKLNERITSAKWDRQKSAQARAAAKRHKQPKEKSNAFGVGTPKTNLDYINSDKYKNKFQSLSDDPALNQAIYKYSKAAVTHQSDSYNEDLTILSLSGKHIGTTSSKIPYETLYTKELKEAIKEHPPYSLVAIHNHGTNVPPSGADLVNAGEKQYAFGVVACHDGSVYCYSCKNARPFLPSLMDNTVDKFRRNPYNMDEVSAYNKALEQLSAEYGVEWRELP